MIRFITLLELNIVTSINHTDIEYLKGKLDYNNNIINVNTTT